MDGRPARALCDRVVAHLTRTGRVSLGAGLVDNFENALLPRLKKRHDILRKHHSRTRLAASATVGELEAIVEDEVDQICAWPRTQHQPTIRNACNKLVEERSDQIVVAISSWARDGSYGLHLKDEIDDELRPALCEQELQVCTSAELEEQVRVDADEKAKMETANDNGFVADRPLESEAPSNAKDDVLVRVVGADFIKRIVVDAADADFLVYMFFPGRTLETEDTHSRMRPKYVRLAQFLDAPGSNGSLIVGWMDCVFNAIPHPHGTHVHQDLVALYPAGRKNQPAYWHNLREGDVELHQLIDFVRDASGNSKTRAHVHDRARELGQRALYEALPSNLMDYEESLFVDERTIEAINVTAMRLSLEEQDGNINRPARLAHNPTSKDEL